MAGVHLLEPVLLYQRISPLMPWRLECRRGLSAISVLISIKKTKVVEPEYDLLMNSTKTKSKVLCIIPAHNEEKSIGSLLRETSSCGYDFIVVNDASVDNTAGIVKSFGVKLLSLPVNLGIGGAVQTGFLYALRNGYDYVVQLDGDGQHNPALIGDILAPLQNNEADCVIGSRYLPAMPDIAYKTPFTRRLGMYFSTCILQLATGITIHDTTSGFRGLNRRAFSYFAYEYPVDHPEAESLLLLHREGFRICEVPTRMRQRVAGKSLFTLTKGLMYPFRVIIGFCGILLRRKSR